MIMLYPNPTQTFFTIATTEKLSYTIYNLTGSLVQQGTIMQNNNSIDVAALATGSYIITTVNENGNTKRGKLIKK